MATLKDVAERAGVSTATVSYVMNNKENKVSAGVAKKVRMAARELGYQPNIAARALRSSRSNIIGIISEDIATFQVNNIVQGINQTADRDVDTDRVFVVHTRCAPGIPENVCDMVRQFGFREVVTAVAGCTISCHCGPNTLGVIFLRK